jgi:acyl-CoA synthetase (AMP-forming)/AMP-acid ligase II
MIKYKAFQVAPAELEGIIASHPAVLDAAVIGVPQNYTEVPRAYVVLAPPAKGKISEEDIMDFVKSKVMDYKRLRGGVRFVDTVPRSASGKILRKELRERRKLEDQQSKL